MNFRLPIDQLLYWERERPNSVFLTQPITGGKKEFTWKEVACEARRIAGGLKALGIPPGSHIGILSKNCAHWMITDFAIWMGGYVSVPLYPNLTAESIREILEHSEARALFVGKLDNWPAIRGGIPKGLPCIAFPYDISEFTLWNDVKGAPLEKVSQPNPSDLATIIYTSGTTGAAKGVMHSYSTIGYTPTEVIKILGYNTTDRFYSYLPLAHVAERLLVELIGLYSGGHIFFVESLDTFSKNLVEARPTIFLGVPRIWTKFQAGVLQKLPQKKLDTLLKIPIISQLIRKKIKRGLGLDACKNPITGAAAAPKSLLDWFAALGLSIQDAYGMTENFAYSHYNPKEKIKRGTVGVAWPHVDVKISPEGELLMKSETMMLGFYKDPEQTRQAIENGYLKTGDLAEVDSEGYLTITGRVKELFKTSKGKYVAPTPIELRLAANTHIEQCCVVGSGFPQPIALVTLNDGARTADPKVIEASLRDSLSKLNQALNAHEKVSRIIIVKETWNVENNFLTPTLKIKRPMVEKFYRERFNDWSIGKTHIDWA